MVRTWSVPEELFFTVTSDLLFFTANSFWQHGFCRLVVIFPDLDINTVTVLEVAFHVVADGTQAKSTFLGT